VFALNYRLPVGFPEKKVKYFECDVGSEDFLPLLTLRGAADVAIAVLIIPPPPSLLSPSPPPPNRSVSAAADL
jgi:hypothetical protein